MMKCIVICVPMIWFLAIHAVHLDELAANYNRTLVEEFKKNPRSTRFDNVIVPPRTGENVMDFFYPKIFTWCPIDHFGLEVKCPEHGSTLQVGGFTEEVERNSPRNPRLRYDLHGNILIIQRYYVYRQRGTSYRYLSASTAVLEGLPPLHANCFQLIMYHRTACTK